jgi:hypothetical protein
MKNKFLSFLIASLINVTGYGFTEMPLETILKHTISVEQEGDQSVYFDISASKKKNKGEWIEFKRRCGIETLVVRFPSYPKVKTKDGMVKTYASEKNAQYTLLTPSVPYAHIDADLFFQTALDYADKDGFTLINYNISSENDREILDLVVKDKKSGYISKSQMIVTENNFYALETIVKPKHHDNHIMFINSFSLTK